MKNPKYFIGLDVHKEHTTHVVKAKIGNILLEGETATLYTELYPRLKPYPTKAIIGLEASTSYYTLYQTFLKKGYRIKVANTIQLRQLIAKNDKLDAQRLSEMLRLGTLPCSYVPEERIQHLRSTIQMRHALMQEKVRCNNRIQAFLDRNGIVMPPVKAFSKKWKHALMQHLGTGNASMELRYEYDYYVYLEKKNEQADQEIIGYTKTYWKLEYNLLRSITGFGILSPAMSSLLSIRSTDSYQTGNSAGTQESSPLQRIWGHHNTGENPEDHKQSTVTLGTGPSSKHHRENQHKTGTVLPSEKESEEKIRDR